MKSAPRRKRVRRSAPRERGGIQSLERAFAILEEVARKREGISLAELSKAVGLHNSTTFHLVKTMVQLGYVSQMRDSKRYRVGSRLFTLAAGALEENAFLELATPVLEKLTRETGEAAHFAIRSGNDIVVIARTAGSGMLQLSDRAGATRPAHATALGKVLLAALPPQELAQFLAGMEMRRYTPNTIVGREALLRELEDVRRKGIAFDDGEFDAELRCVAVPVYDFAGRVAGAIGISGPIWRLSLQSLQDKAKQARDSAAELSTGLGFRKRSETTARSA
jgi:IclR family transcriptional regulator, KDG regulon repressor